MRDNNGDIFVVDTNHNIFVYVKLTLKQWWNDNNGNNFECGNDGVIITEITPMGSHYYIKLIPTT